MTLSPNAVYFVDHFIHNVAREIFVRSLTRLLYVLVEIASPSATVNHLSQCVPHFGALSQPLLDIFLPMSDLMASVSHSATCISFQIVLTSLLSLIRCVLQTRGTSISTIRQNFHVLVDFMRAADDGQFLKGGNIKDFFHLFFRRRNMTSEKPTHYRKSFRTRDIILLELLTKIPKLFGELWLVINRAYYFKASFGELKFTALLLFLEKLTYVFGILLANLMSRWYAHSSGIYALSHGAAFVSHHLCHVVLACIFCRSEKSAQMARVIPARLGVQESFYAAASECSLEELTAIQSSIRRSRNRPLHLTVIDARLDAPGYSLRYSPRAARFLLGKLIERKENQRWLIGCLFPRTVCVSDANAGQYIDKTCCICLENYALGDTVITLWPCLHEFHKKEIIAWLEAHGDCPLCRRKTIFHFSKYLPVLANVVLTVPFVSRRMRALQVT